MTSNSSRLGFLGTGAIAEAMVHGLVGHAGYDGPIVLSPRSRERSSRLAGQYETVVVAESNQSLVDACGTVVVAVLPPNTQEILEALEWRTDQNLLSLAGGRTTAELKRWTRGPEHVLRAIPMPPVERGVGPIPLYPRHDDVEALLNRVGTVIPLDKEQHFDVFSASSATMATFFEMQGTVARWTAAQGVDAQLSTTYTTTLLDALATMSSDLDAETLQGLSEECLTSGGLNERVLRGLQKDAWFERLEEGLQDIADLLASRQPERD
ncbi:MAG: NAD(P)-binding domain-containing protein [Acidobacteriota bacterium]